MFGINKTLSIDEAAEALLKLMQSDFKPEWRSRLAGVSGLDPVRAEDELIFIRFFRRLLLTEVHTVSEMAREWSISI